MANFFISYSRKDAAETAKNLRKYICKLDSAHDVFLDSESIKPGVNWKAELQKKIKDCDHFVYIHSKASLESPYIKQELSWVYQSELKTGIRKMLVYRLGYADLFPQLAPYQVMDATDDFVIDFYKLMTGVFSVNSFYTVEHEIKLADEFWYKGKFWIEAPVDFLKKIQMVEYRFDYGWDDPPILVKYSATTLKRKFAVPFDTKYHFTIFVMLYLWNTKELAFSKTIPIYH
ncbi:MAG: toll/interleukin-1 receptor domain-containing protein [Chitinophagaceae bacterium]|nr:toll/interleukin-1 receptor domain-containing protein [Chitinophagaceae bacterium]